MSDESAIEVKSVYDHLIDEEKNKYPVCCTKCPSKILPSTMGKHMKTEVSLYTNNWWSDQIKGWL